MSEFVVYHVGYRSGWTPRRLAAEIAGRGLDLIDIRFAPGRPGAVWSRENLSRLLGGRYRWAGDMLGNRNYRGGGPIELVDATTGIMVLGSLLRGGYTPVLMCACSDYASCHRQLVVDLLSAEVGGSGTMRAVELTPTIEEMDGGLFGG